MKLLVTGGRGFIGSHFVEEALKSGHEVIDIDKMSYASNEVLPFDNHKRYTLIEEDISEIKHVPLCDAIVNFAAESHVDNSIRDTEPFIKSNIIGVWNLLELVKGKEKHNRPLFFHISTDEVYGDRDSGSFIETDSLKPSNPYSATKASAEMLVLSYHRTYGIDYVITRSANNYGERQYVEKLIPRILDSVRNDKKVPVHGDGTYVRDWTYVKDNVSAILMILEKGLVNDTFNIATENHMQNVEVIREVASWFDKGDEVMQFVPNRWGQDKRYSVSSKKIRDLGWEPKKKHGIFKWF